jgi:hypothetical protein
MHQYAYYSHFLLDRSSLNYDLLLFFLFVCFVLLCDFTFLVPWCDVRYDFRIKTMFGSCLTPVVHRMAYVLYTLFVFACVYSGNIRTPLLSRIPALET